MSSSLATRQDAALSGTPRSAAATGAPAPDVPAADLPAAVAVDLGSAWTGVWSAGRGVVGAPTTGEALSSPVPLVRRGRVVDAAGCVSLLTRLARAYADPLPPGSVVVACRPVSATAAEQAAMRRLLTLALDPARVLFIETVRAAAIGSGAAAGALALADVGAELTEVALLSDGAVVAARHAEIGTRDLARGAGAGLLAEIVARLVAELRRDATARALAGAALARGLVLVGDGATEPELTAHLSHRLRTVVRCAGSPRSAALSGAGLAAMAATRHPGAAG